MTDSGTTAAPSPGADTIDWRPTTAQKVGAVVGAGIGALSAAGGVPVPVGVAFVPAYAVACGVIPRLRGIVAHERRAPFAAHQVAMGTIAAGWLVAGETAPAVFNGGWLVSAGLWWVTTRRRQR